QDAIAGAGGNGAADVAQDTAKAAQQRATRSSEGRLGGNEKSRSARLRLSIDITGRVARLASSRLEADANASQEAMTVEVQVEPDEIVIRLVPGVVVLHLRIRAAAQANLHARPEVEAVHVLAERLIVGRKGPVGVVEREAAIGVAALGVQQCRTADL